MRFSIPAFVAVSIMILTNVLMRPACTNEEKPSNNVSLDSSVSQRNFSLQFKLLQPTGWIDLGLTNAEITHAQARLNERAAWTVEIELTPIGYSKFRYLTASLIGYPIGIFVNGQPSYGTGIKRGFTVIQPCPLTVPGDFTEGQAKNLANKLNAQRFRTKDVTPSNLSKVNLSTKLSSQDLTFGRKQLEMMLNDRIEMKPFVRPGDNLWNWTVNQFAGEGTSNKIFWGGDILPQHPPSIDSTISVSDNGSECLRLREISRFGVPIDGEMLWSRVVYELFNARGAKANFPAINEKAKGGLITRDAYIRQIASLEYDAYRQTLIFYKTIWRPHAEQNNLTSSDVYWRTDLPETFEAWMSQFTDPNGYPFSVYGKTFDRITSK